MSVRRSIQRHLVNDNILKHFFTLTLSLFYFLDPTHLYKEKDDDEGLVPLNSIASLYISSYFYFQQSIITKIIQSALTDPKVINLSNQHFSVFVSSPFQSISTSLSLSLLLYLSLYATVIPFLILSLLLHFTLLSSSLFLPINYLLCLKQKTSNDKIY